MNADDFWARQREKNKRSQPRYQIFTDASTPQEAAMCAWIEKWRDQFSYFDNSGCGCCVNLYEFDAPAEAVAEIPRAWLQTAS